MLYKILADTIVVIHFVWILFMLTGFLFTVIGFLRREIFDWFLFRVLHLFGIVYVSLKALMGKYCPLTVWENTLRAKYDPGLTYPGSFMIYYVQKLVYPEINPLIIQLPTIFIAVSTVVIFIVKPPQNLKQIFKIKFK